MSPDVGTLVVGGGPAALAPLVAASRQGRLDDVLSRGVAVVERGRRLGSGGIGAHEITSDSSAETFLSAVAGHRDPRLGEVADHPVARELASRGRGAVPLSLAAAFLDLVGDVLHRAVLDAGGDVLTGHDALSTRMRDDGGWDTSVAGPDGAATLSSPAVLLATGAVQRDDHLWTSDVAGAPLLPRCSGRLVMSGEILAHGGVETTALRLAGVTRPRVVVVGGPRAPWRRRLAAQAGAPT